MVALLLVLGLLSACSTGERPAAPEVTIEQTAEISQSPRQTSEKRSKPSKPRVVHPGAFCDHRGAKGVTKAGTRMECRGKSDDLRWRKKTS